MMAGRLLLLPCGVADGMALATLPAATIEAARGCGHFLAENARTARAFLKEVGHPRPLQSLQIVQIGHAPEAAAVDDWLQPLAAGHNLAVVAEAGCPGVADPGALIAARAHARGFSVRPLVGPSAILLALMAGGGNGQRFRFVGYLPQDSAERTLRLRELEAAARSGETQLFIETPYRNERLFDALLATCAPATRLSVAVALTAPDEFIATRSIAQWRSAARPMLTKRPAVFSLLPPQR
ncbi:MAG: SAM-dependent methyltransferase [Burkholderiaceae bacterium]|nr:SAM-dependent methyltransferase [Burkholderiaceae bacterium]